jgi:diguanylate cyclase (GGDEF)-like protein/PAS domain S-box-containing protein
MTNREWIRARLTSTPIWWAACALLILIGLLLTFHSQRHWRDRAAVLERDNLTLQLQQLANAVLQESERLAERAAALSRNEQIIQLAQETAGPPLDHALLVGLTRGGVHNVLIVSASEAVRFSADIAGDRLTVGAPAPELMRFLQKVPATDASALLGFSEGRWMAAQPIMSRAAPALMLGWVVVACAPMVAQPAGAMRADLPKLVEIKNSGNFTVSTHLAGDNSAGYAELRDPSGRALRRFPLRSGATNAQTAAASGTGIGFDYAIAALTVAVALTAIGLLACRRHIRRQKSVAGRYKAIIDQANDGIVIVDAQTQAVLYTNPAFGEQLGYASDEALALRLPDIFADGFAANMNSQLAANVQLRCKNGTFIDMEVRCNALAVEGREVLAYVTHDVSLRRKVEQQLIENKNRLDRMAHHDQLTGLPNRHYLAAFLPDAIAAAQAASTMLGVVFLDLDRFKHINDTRGHETGDKLLQEVAARLRAVVRDSDVVIRMGGDEFVVVFRDVKSYDEITLGAGRIIETLNRPIIIDQHPLQTTGSVGVSLFPRDGSTMVELLKHSDTAMYQAKDRGRNNVQMFSQVMNRKLKARVAVEASLREALRLKQLDVHYQPFINLQTRKVVGLEALIRWCHPVHGMIPADQFIPVAEETGLIVPMGNFVLHRALQNMTAWRKAGVPLVPMSLNVAPAQLQRGELQSTIATLLKSHGFRPQLLQLEMTERAMFDSHAPATENRQDTMARLRDLGIKIAIDDFGTGYSSLSYLKHWRVDSLKIDRSFVRDLVTDSSDLAIVSAIIAIARHLHIEVIAEGIEAYQQVEILRRLGCSVGQGFLFARPMPAEQCLELLGDNAETEKADDEDMLAIFSAGRG